jgi:acetyl esterase/lipase
MDQETDLSKEPKTSLAYRFLELAVKSMGYKKTFSLDEEGLERYIEKTIDKQRISPPGFIYRKNQVREWTLEGRPCYIVSPKKGAGPRKTVLFLHGGGMIMETLVIHWLVIAKLVKDLGVTVWVPAYPLAPRGFKEITEWLFRVYGKMLEENPGPGFTLLGDSAGGALGVMLCHHNKALGRPLAMPAKLILVSPGIFVGQDNRAIRDGMDRIVPRDPLLSPKLMDVLFPRMGADPNRGSYLDLPMEGDFSLFPETHVFFGTNEIFYAAAAPFIDKIKAGGVPVKLYTGIGMMHIWPYMPVSRECRAALKTIFDIVRKEEISKL